MGEIHPILLTLGLWTCDPTSRATESHPSVSFKTLGLSHKWQSVEVQEKWKMGANGSAIVDSGLSRVGGTVKSMKGDVVLAVKGLVGMVNSIELLVKGVAETC